MSFTVRLITDEGVFEHKDVTLIAEMMNGTMLIDSTDERHQLSNIRHIDVFWNKVT